jgi:NADH:ubiquinone oxidoreductase subunit 5 (subunit L)/multisubunit Na+/H+ antiporter MnhA subunit
VPLIMLAPLAAFVLAATSVRTRRSAANMAMLGTIVSFLATLLTAWGLARTTKPFQATYSYMNVSVAFSGPTSFQGFGIDIILRVDHVTVIALLVIELCMIGALGWHRVVGRSEPGPARFYAVASVFLFGAAATLVSWDLAELLAFWGLTGAMTYLLLSHRWASDDTARTARVALVLPFLTDLCLIAGVGVLYSRYGVQNLTGLVPILHITPGAGVRTLVVASALIFAGIAGRLALWPLHFWITRTAATAAPAASAIAQAAWPVIAIVVLYRLMPIISATNAQTLRYLLYACGVSAVLAPLASFVGNEPRRVIALAGSGVAALGAAVVVHGSQHAGFTFAVAGVAAVLAAAPARAAGILASSAVASAMRTDDMAEMGDGWRRMRLSSGLLLVSAVVISASASGALAYGVSTRSRLGVAVGEAVFLIAVATLRAFFAVAFGPLRRRRAFEPDRVREAPGEGLGYAYWLVLGGGVLAVAALVNAWIHFLDGLKHPAASTSSLLIWILAAAVGLVAVVIAFRASKDGALRATALAGSWFDRVAGVGGRAFDRFIYAPAADVTRRAGDWILVGDGAIAAGVVAAARLALTTTSRASAPALVLLVVVLAALVVGLLAPGVYR